MPKRSEIVQAARNFLETPFIHQGRKVGVGVDCVGLPLCVAESFGLRDKAGIPMLSTDNGTYGPQPQSDIVLAECKRRLLEIPEIKEGCVLALKSASVVCHSAIVSKAGDEFCVIHADGTPGTSKVVEVPLGRWKSRIKGIFDFPSVED